MQLNRDFRERQGEGWERPDAMDQRFNPIDTCPECDEPTERELAVIDGEKLCNACIDDPPERRTQDREQARSR